MAKIQARVNNRLLTKASRLFTGTLPGRIIEILQNARRSGAKNVVITNHEGTVTVRDDGRGIDDFSKLLDLGGSGWDSDLEASEDPAGVGLFCLSPRELTIHSRENMVLVDATGWVGAPVSVVDKSPPLSRQGSIPAGVGTELSFKDDFWDLDTVSLQAVFSGMQVTVDGEDCPCEPFITGECVTNEALGCRIQIIEDQELSNWHRITPIDRFYHHNVRVNFHGQVVAMDYQPVIGEGLRYLVDMTGQSTGLRLMLPARTCLIENEALAALKLAIEVEVYRYLQRRGHHKLSYNQFVRAKGMGIDLPEAVPDYSVGLIGRGEEPSPVEVGFPKGHLLKDCYRASPGLDEAKAEEDNIHLLAALGKFDTPFVPVRIDKEYDGYSWAKLPTVDQVVVTQGKVLCKDYMSTGEIECVSSLSIRATCSDGKVFHSKVPLAVVTPRYDTPLVRVTPDCQVGSSQIWYHFGGYYDEGDTYETQEYEFGKAMEEFWRKLVGPLESTRVEVLQALAGLPKGWKYVTVYPNGKVTIMRRKKLQTLLPPKAR